MGVSREGMIGTAARPTTALSAKLMSMNRNASRLGARVRAEHLLCHRPSLRKRPGDSPTSRRKRAVKDDWLSKPTAPAIWTRDRSE
jgi:hypothetical protein